VAGIDPSVGAVLALSSVLSVGLVNDFGVPVAAAIAASLGAGALIGVINGLNVTLTKIPALIATLAMLTVTRGLAFIYSDGQNIAPVPDFYIQVQAARILGVPVIILFTLAIGILAHFVLTRTRFGRSIYATGGNPVAARLSGIRVNRVIVLAYTISDVLAALGGRMITARLEAGAATAGQGTELTVISAVVIDGVSLFGGEGKIAGVLLGVLLLGRAERDQPAQRPAQLRLRRQRLRDRRRRGARRLPPQLPRSRAAATGQSSNFRAAKMNSARLPSKRFGPEEKKEP
jgi:ribose transport system permease protein